MLTEIEDFIEKATAKGYTIVSSDDERYDGSESEITLENPQGSTLQIDIDNDTFKIFDGLCCSVANGKELSFLEVHGGGLNMLLDDFPFDELLDW